LLAADALDAAGRSWSIVLQSAGAAGLAAAVEAGLGVSVFGQVAPPLRPLGAAEGFPALPDFEYVLRQNGDGSLAVARLAEVIVDFFQLSAALRRPPGESRVAGQDFRE
jgi:hypothetical protein